MKGMLVGVGFYDELDVVAELAMGRREIICKIHVV